jgi:hypothetical protein
MNLITIKQFPDEVLARLYHHRLEEEGIKSVISNTVSSTLFPIGAGTFSIQILDIDFDQAKKIIFELDELYKED